MSAVVAAPVHAQGDEIDEGIRITSATLGEECGARPGNLTWPIVQKCDGEKFCRFPLTQDMIDSASVDGERCANRLAISWRCANRPETFEELSPRRANPPGVDAGYITLISCPPEAADEIPLPAAKLRSVQISDSDRPAFDRELSLVRVMRNNARVETEIGMDLLPGDKISTSANTIALINYPETAAVMLEPNTRVLISSIFVEIGAIIADVVDVVDRIIGEFKVETTYVTAGAKGTVFRVAVDPAQKETTVTVAEGFVDLEPKGRPQFDALLIAGQELTISAEPEAVPIVKDVSEPEAEGLLFVAFRSNQLADCTERAGEPVRNGEVIKKTASGPNEITIDNGNNNAAYVKFKNTSGDTIVSFYVDGRREAAIKNFPYGDFNVSWATGKQFSRGCGIFLEDMMASRSGETIRLRSNLGPRIGRLTLHAVAGGTMPMERMPLRDFLRD